ncbi:hypothetical protein Tco_0733783 [Tanacetum coccineum]
MRATRMKKRGGVFKQGRKVVKSSKGEPSAHKDPAFDDFEDDCVAPLDDEMDYQRTEEVQGEDSTALHQGTEGQKVSTDSIRVSTDGLKVSTDNTKVSTDQVEEGTDELKKDEPKEQTPIPTALTVTKATFGDDETIAKVLLNMSQSRAVTRKKEKRVELRDVEESERPRATSTRSILTLKPLPNIDPKDKGKKRIEEDDESNFESEEITTAEKKFKQLSTDEELARKVQEDWEAEEERKRLPSDPHNTPTHRRQGLNCADGGSERPNATSTRSLLTYKALPNIDPQDQGKKRIEEDDESNF